MSDTGFQDVPTEDFSQIPANGAGMQSAESIAKARQHGWMEGAKLDYNAIAAPASDAPAWASSAKVYEWADDEGDIGARDEDLEEQLFAKHAPAGTALDHILNFKATVEGPRQFPPVVSVSLFLPLLKANPS